MDAIMNNRSLAKEGIRELRSQSLCWVTRSTLAGHAGLAPTRPWAADRPVSIALSRRALRGQA
jgi:hypothetical protein